MQSIHNLKKAQIGQKFLIKPDWRLFTCSLHDFSRLLLLQSSKIKILIIQSFSSRLLIQFRTIAKLWFWFLLLIGFFIAPPIILTCRFLGKGVSKNFIANISIQHILVSLWIRQMNEFLKVSTYFSLQIQIIPPPIAKSWVNWPWSSHISEYLSEWIDEAINTNSWHSS